MTLEICVDDIAGLDSAISGGADRLELCSALTIGGLTPAPSLIAAAREAPIPAHVLVRPREGGFRYDRRDMAMIAADIAAVAEAGLAGVVIGASAADHTLDTSSLGQLVSHARSLGAARGSPLSLTLHRAFDLCPDLVAALDTAIALGFDRVLTSGGQPKAIAGLATLAALDRHACGRIIILAGSGIDADNATCFLDAGLSELHASCGAQVMPSANEDDARERRFGFVAPGRRATNRQRVRDLRRILDTHNQSVA